MRKRGRMNALKYSMSLVAGVYIIYHIYVNGVTNMNALMLGMFIISLGAELARNKKRKEEENKRSDSN